MRELDKHDVIVQCVVIELLMGDHLGSRDDLLHLLGCFADIFAKPDLQLVWAAGKKTEKSTPFFPGLFISEELFV